MWLTDWWHVPKNAEPQIVTRWRERLERGLAEPMLPGTGRCWPVLRALRATAAVEPGVSAQTPCAEARVGSRARRCAKSPLRKASWQGTLQSAPKPPARPQYSCQPTVKLLIYSPSNRFFLWERGSMRHRGQQLGFSLPGQ